MKTYRLPRCRKTCLPGWILHLCTLCLQPVTSSLAFHPAVQSQLRHGGDEAECNGTQGCSEKAIIVSVKATVDDNMALTARPVLTGECKDMGGELQKWRTTAEYRAYMDFIFTDFNSYQDMWIGASDEVKEGTFLWHDGTPAGIPWKAEFGEPRGGAAEDCVFVGMGTYQMSPTFVVVSPAFQDTSCSGARKFVCVFFGEEL